MWDGCALNHPASIESKLTRELICVIFRRALGLIIPTVTPADSRRDKFRIEESAGPRNMFNIALHIKPVPLCSNHEGTAVQMDLSCERSQP